MIYADAVSHVLVKFGENQNDALYTRQKCWFPETQRKSYGVTDWRTSTVLPYGA